MSSPLTSSHPRRTMHACHLGGRYQDYSPRFSVAQFGPRRWWVMDGAVQVAVVLGEEHVAELINHDPLAPWAAVAFPDPYHAATQPGDRITLSKFIDAVGGTSSARQQLRFETADDGVTLVFDECWTNGREARKILHFHVDPDFGYSIRCTDSMSFPGSDRHDVSQEYCNFLPRGVTDNRPETGARYPHILWQHPDGRVLRWNQNNISARALGVMDTLGERRVGNGGFIGFFGEADYDIAIVIEESTPGTTCITCPNMLDQHVMWLPVTDEGARYHAVSTLVAVPPAVSAALIAESEPLDMILDRPAPELVAWNGERTRNYPQQPGASHTFDFFPLLPGEVADFETPLDAMASFRGQVFPYRENADGPISIDSNCAHAGRRSLRVRVENETVHAIAQGCALHVTEGQLYRLSAWIKPQMTAGSAALVGMQYQFGPGNVTGDHRAEALIGKQEWQYVETFFTPGERAHVVDVRFEVTGSGTAWIDEILLQKVEL